MLAKPVAEIPPGQLYEPEWHGFRSIIFRDGDDVEIGSRDERPMTRYFPEIVVADTARNTFSCWPGRRWRVSSRSTYSPGTTAPCATSPSGSDDAIGSTWPTSSVSRS